MDKTAIKNFAVWARVKLMEDIRTRLGFLGITEDGIVSPLSASTREVQYFDIGADHPGSIKGVAIRQRETIADQIHKAERESSYANAYQHFIETSAYDWFNRLIAIRYMELNEYAPLDVRLLSSIEPGKQDPDLVTAPFDSSLEYTEKEEQQIRTWKEEHDNNKLFRFLLFKMCNQLHEVLPGIFEGKGDASELLMRQSFIDKDGVIHHLVMDIPEEDWKDQVQIIGWIYQYYNSELKDETFKLLKKNVKITKDRIPSATQLFTPDWIVRYMVENSLGRLWIEHLRGLDPSVDEKETADQFGWKYYLPEEKQEPEVDQQLKKIREESYAKLTPEDLTCLDPCMGSGHILVYMFDVLEQIYTSVGYSERDAAKSILEHNIYGLDIDDRAYQLAYFAVMMKARQYNRRILTSDIKPHVYSIQESNGITRLQLQEMGVNLSAEEKAKALKQAEQLVDLFQDAKEYGSILNIPEMEWDLLRRFAEPDENNVTLFNWKNETSNALFQLIDQGQVMAKKYWITCTNPPYISSSNSEYSLANYINNQYSEVKQDLYTCFIKKCLNYTNKYGFVGMMTSYTWMFLSTFKATRNYVLTSGSITSLVQPEYHSFFEEAFVPICSFCLVKGVLKEYGSFFNLNDFYGPNIQSEKFIEAIEDKECKYRYYASIKEFQKIDGWPIAYWLSPNILKVIDKSKPLTTVAVPRQGLATADNNRFLRMWQEVSIDNINIHAKGHEDAKSSSKKWYPYCKGGQYRKWSGNFSYLINWKNDGNELKGFKKSVLRNQQYYFKHGLTWGSLTVGDISFRYVPNGFLFDSKGPMCFAKKDINELYLLAILNSKVAMTYLEVLAPTMDYSQGPVGKLPFISTAPEQEKIITTIVRECIKLSLDDWNQFETAYGFSGFPLIIGKYRSIEDSYNNYVETTEINFNDLRDKETQLNEHIKQIYGLEDEIQSEIEEKNVSITRIYDSLDSVPDSMRANAYIIYKADVIRSLLSYIVGCIFGRYSLDKEGLIYAGGDWKSMQFVYKTFLPDQDNVVPITDQKYLEDDVVERICEFLTVVYGADTLEENLDFVAKALGNKGLTNREVIRNYMLNDFFKDHCKTYSVTGSGKRPIYWLFDSGKQNAFKALVYMHRWDADTTGRVLLYAQQIQQKYETEVRAIDVMLDHITDAKQASTEEKRREHLKKQLDELIDYEERLEHMANERIAIDLDDGVKVNYEKVQTDRNGKKYQILVPIK